MEKIQIAIAVPNRSLILTVLNHTLIVGFLIVSSRCTINNRRDREAFIVITVGRRAFAPPTIIITGVRGLKTLEQISLWNKDRDPREGDEDSKKGQITLLNKETSKRGINWRTWIPPAFPEEQRARNLVEDQGENNS